MTHYFFHRRGSAAAAAVLLLLASVYKECHGVPTVVPAVAAPQTVAFVQAATATADPSKRQAGSSLFSFF
jgi:hypothetical protein